MESEEEEKINQKKIEEQNILTEEEIINTLDMTPYKERIENIIGKQYSYIYFIYFENIYHSKIKNKMSLPLAEYLNNENNTNNTLWMHIYKSIKFYSKKENLPIIITKYFHLKAEYEFKFLLNESKKYTSNPYKFFDIYIKKMKKANQKKLAELKEKNPNIITNIFDLHKKQSIFVRSFISKKTVIRPKFSLLRNSKNLFNQEDEHSELSNKEEEIKHKKERRLQIIKQIHQLKINSIKEVEKANILQNKQKKKYGGIKSRFLDAYNQREKFFKIINSHSSGKFAYNYKNIELEKTNLSSKRMINNSKNSSRTFLYLNTYSKENNFTSRKNSNLNLVLTEEKKTRNNYSRRINSSKKNYRNNKFYNGLLMKGFSPKNLKALNFFRVEYNSPQINSKDKILLSNNNLKTKENSGNKKINSTANYNKKTKMKKNGLNLKKVKTTNLIEKFNKKRNDDILENLRLQKYGKENEGYNNILYNIFKRTEVF